MLFQEMRYVYEVYRQRGFSKAAQALYIAQPSLSQMVKKAEKRIGGPIFDRSTVPIGLTALGRAYIQAAEEMMRIENGFSRYLMDAEQCLTGVLTFGGTTLFTSYVLPPLISAFSSRYPGVEIRLHEQHTGALRQRLQEGILDFSVGNTLFEPAIFESHVYQTEQLIVAMPRVLITDDSLLPYEMTAAFIHNKETQKVPPLPLRLLSNVPFLFLKEGNDTRARADRLCTINGFHPKIRLQLDQQIAAYHLAAYGLGAAFISDTLAKRAPVDDRLVFFRLGEEEARRSIYVTHKKNRFLSAPMSAFLRMIQEESV